MQIIGYVTKDTEKASGVMADLPHFGDDAALLRRGPEGISLVNGIGSIGDTSSRRAIFEKFDSAGFSFAPVVHPAATIASDVKIGAGAQIMAGAILQPGVSVGKNAIVNTGAVVDHDTTIGDHSHVAPRACLSGGVKVGNSVHIGAGSTVIQCINVDDGALVAAGSVVISDVPARAKVMGVPARRSDR
jgi:sugar O-acyltransferase (sialic acid O-acetyltransferase NeuD family)